MAPPYVDENPNAELTEQGMRIAENEKRDTVIGAYEAEAVESPDSEEELDDISYPEGASESNSPELSAMKEDRLPGSE